MLYYRGYTTTETLRRIKDRYGLAASPRTLTAWLQEHKPITSYARQRTEGREVFPPHRLIRTTRLHHQQVYHYRVHNGKLSLILNTKQHHNFAPIKTYLDEMATDCPHLLFQDGNRVSKGRATFLGYRTNAVKPIKSTCANTPVIGKFPYCEATGWF